MKLSHIASRLTKIESYLGMEKERGKEKYASESTFFLPRTLLYWRKPSKRFNQPLFQNHQTNWNLNNIYQCIEMNFSCLSSTLISQSLGLMQPWLAGVLQSLSSNRKHNTNVRASNFFGGHAPKANQTFAKAKSFPHSQLNRNKDIIINSASDLPEFKLQLPSKIQLLSFLNKKRSATLITLHGRQQHKKEIQIWEVSNKQSSGYIPSKLLTSENISTLGFKMPIKSFVGGINSESIHFAIDIGRERKIRSSSPERAGSFKKLSNHELFYEPNFSARKVSTNSAALAWRNPLHSVDTEFPLTTLNKKRTVLEENVQAAVMDEYTESKIAEKVISLARQSLVQELFKGANLDRLADDVMRRLDKRLRIDRERRGL